MPISLALRGNVSPFLRSCPKLNLNVLDYSGMAVLACHCGIRVKWSVQYCQLSRQPPLCYTLSTTMSADRPRRMRVSLLACMSTDAAKVRLSSLQYPAHHRRHDRNAAHDETANGENSFDRQGHACVVPCLCVGVCAGVCHKHRMVCCTMHMHTTAIIAGTPWSTKDGVYAARAGSSSRTHRRCYTLHDCQQSSRSTMHQSIRNENVNMGYCVTTGMSSV